MITKFVSVALVVAVILLGVISGYFLIQGPQTTTQTSTRTITTTQVETEIQISFKTNTQNAPPQLRVVTISEVILGYYVEEYTEYISGNCTADAGTVFLSETSASTSYYIPGNATGLLNVTVVSDASMIIVSSVTSTIYTSLQPETITIVNGSSTTFTTMTCPIFS